MSRAGCGAGWPTPQPVGARSGAAQLVMPPNIPPVMFSTWPWT